MEERRRPKWVFAARRHWTSSGATCAGDEKQEDGPKKKKKPPQSRYLPGPDIKGLWQTSATSESSTTRRTARPMPHLGHQPDPDVRPGIASSGSLTRVHFAYEIQLDGLKGQDVSGMYCAKRREGESARAATHLGRQ